MRLKNGPHCDVNRLEEEIATLRLELSTERDAVAQYIGERNGLREKLDEESQRNVDMLVTLADHVVAQGRLLAERDTIRTKLNNYGAGWDAAERGHPRDESKGMEWLDGFEYWKALEELEKLRTQLAQAQNEALEQAAQVCDLYAGKAMNDYASPEWASEEAAKDIRAMKSPE